MKLWVDDVRPTPNDDYFWVVSVNQAKTLIEFVENTPKAGQITLIDIDHDAGTYASDGGDYIKLLDWLERTKRSYPIRIHSMNPVGVENMRRIIRKNGWLEIR